MKHCGRRGNCLQQTMVPIPARSSKSALCEGVQGFRYIYSRIIFFLSGDELKQKAQERLKDETVSE